MPKKYLRSGDTFCWFCFRVGQLSSFRPFSCFSGLWAFDRCNRHSWPIAFAFANHWNSWHVFWSLIPPFLTLQVLDRCAINRGFVFRFYFITSTWQVHPRPVANRDKHKILIWNRRYAILNILKQHSRKYSKPGLHISTNLSKHLFPHLVK